MHRQIFKNVVLESFGLAKGPQTLSSAEIEDTLAPLYSRLGVPLGTLERLSGISNRNFWPKNVMPSQIGEIAARDALDQSKIDPSKIGVIMSCSVSRDYFEPATATLIHRKLGFPSSTVALDVTNACLGFSNGISLIGTMIDAGMIEAGLVVSGESVTTIFESTVQSLLRRPDINRDNLLQLLPVLTLGCGGVAAVVCHERHAKQGHKVLSMVSRTASEFNDLCNGNADFAIRNFADSDFSTISKEELLAQPLMFTEASKLITSAAGVGNRAWQDLSELVGWTKDDVDHVFCHQVGRQVNEAWYREVGLDIEKEFNIYKDYGNMVSAALPSALAIGAKEKPLKTGDRVVTMGFGSGLNAVFTAWKW